MLFFKGQTVTVQTKRFFYGNTDDTPFAAVVVADVDDTDQFAMIVIPSTNKVYAVPTADVS